MESKEINNTEYKPNYKTRCVVCDSIPTVDVYEGGKLAFRTEMCGPCTWGEADCIDPNNW